MLNIRLLISPYHIVIYIGEDFLPMHIVEKRFIDEHTLVGNLLYEGFTITSVVYSSQFEIVDPDTIDANDAYREMYMKNEARRKPIREDYTISRNLQNKMVRRLNNIITYN